MTQLFLLTQPEYQSKLKHVWLLPEVPKDVRIFLNLPDLDKGIDLIAETKTGEYWAIQSKFKSDYDKALNYDELSTFSTLSFVYCKNIKLGIVAHTSNKPIRNRKLLGNVTELGISAWLELTDEEWQAIRALTDEVAAFTIEACRALDYWTVHDTFSDAQKNC